MTAEFHIQGTHDHSIATKIRETLESQRVFPKLKSE